MTKNKKTAVLVLIASVILCCIVMTVLDAVMTVSYFIKFPIKILLFTAIPVLFSLFFDRKDRLKSFCGKFKVSRISLLLGAGAFIVILSVYFAFGSFFDLSNITVSLENNVGVNKNNFVIVSLCIAFFNSLLEEFFFRGYAYFILKSYVGLKAASVFSAAVFSLYHVAIMKGWFSAYLMILLISALFLVGLFFIRLDEKTQTIYPSWIVHIFANFAINFIGFILFSS